MAITQSAPSRARIAARLATMLHAITRNRQLTAQVLGYAPDGPLDYGLDRVAVTLPENFKAANLKVIDYDVHTAEELPFPADHFDAVTMLAVFEHIEPAVRALLTEASAAL